ncbi:protein FAM57A-like isoform X2 [Cynoglossus semilaevis]|uniref:protein FAM57A-like isoform X2 n=1 Tax=Cynoglossus semilaevis TaxID=244447 RepID=UPI000D62FAC0|nr:protein FAM57A-like isoform X2 [Cynoglossus semilaevis]
MYEFSTFFVCFVLFYPIRLVSAVHATLATAVGVTVVTSCSDVMTDSHWLVNGFVVFGAPYMAYDIYAMYLTHFYTQRDKSAEGAHSRHSLHTVRAFLLREWMLVLHHLVLLVVFLPVVLFLRRGLGDFFIGCFFITELSTPFICLGKILIQLGLDNSRLHRINGVIVLLTFFTCRILVFPFMYWMYGRQFRIPLHRVPFVLPLHCNVCNLVILVPQIYWFILLLKKARRLYLRGQKRRTADTNTQDKMD